MNPAPLTTTASSASSAATADDAPPVPPLPQLAGSRAGLHAVARALYEAVAVEMDGEGRGTPLPPGPPTEVLAAVSDLLGPAVVPAHGVGEHAALRRIARILDRLGVDLDHPRTAAHLQPPPLSVSVAADALAGASNASLDSYDSGPSAIGIERWVLRALTRLAGFGEHAAGVLTPGGSLSNLMAVLLARDAAATRLGVDVRHQGIAAIPNPVLFCSELAHFSIDRAAAALGLGEQAVVPVPVDDRHRLRTEVLAGMLRDLRPDRTPLAVIATAGTTGYGSIDPLPQIAELAGEYGLWMHVDAAYGFGALFSPALAPKLAGLELADSITLDLHKVGWQPAPSSALLVADPSAFAVLDREVDYLNPADDCDAGWDGLLGRSLQTTRRADAVKVAVTLLAHGTDGMGRLVDICHDLARHAEERIAATPGLELLAGAELTTVAFRYVGGGEHSAAVLDAVNGELRRRLAEAGHALIGRTAVPEGAPGPQVCLKFTLLNPTATASDIDAILDQVVATGDECLPGVSAAAVSR